MTANPFAALLAGVPDYDAGLLNDYGGGNTEWWQDYIRAEIGRANDAWRENLLAALTAVPADLTEAEKVLDRHADKERNVLLNIALMDLDGIINGHNPEVDTSLNNLVWDRLDKLAVAIERKSTAPLLARIAAQEAQIKGLEAALVKINVGEGWAAQIARKALKEAGHEPT